jgi:hypothetical protein
VAIGTVKFFNMSKGYGFLAPDQGGPESSCMQRRSSAPVCPCRAKATASVSKWRAGAMGGQRRGRSGGCEPSSHRLPI